MKTSPVCRIAILFLSVAFCSINITFAQDNKVYTTPDKAAMYPGGNYALTKFIKDNIRYPEEAKTANVKGTVVVSFIVEKSGVLTSIEVIFGIGKGCDEEALRIVRKMKQWFPGSVGGKSVRSLYKLSIKFPPA